MENNERKIDREKLLSLTNHNQILNYLKKMDYNIFYYNSLEYNNKATIVNVDDKLTQFSFLKNTISLKMFSVKSFLKGYKN